MKPVTRLAKQKWGSLTSGELEVVCATLVEEVEELQSRVDLLEGRLLRLAARLQLVGGELVAEQQEPGHLLQGTESLEHSLPVKEREPRAKKP